VQNIRVEVTDKDGWRKEYVLQKTINHIGADARNDIALDNWRGTGVSARHLQLIVNGNSCRLVNIGGTDVSIASGVYDVAPGTTPPQVRPLASMSATEISNGTWIKLGDFSLRLRTAEPPPVAVAASVSQQPVMPSLSVPPPPPVLQGQATASLSTPSIMTPPAPVAEPEVGGNSINVRLLMPQTLLGLNAPLEGSLIVRNAGSRPGAQFKLEIQGLPAECIEIGPGPILFPNAEKEVVFRLRHPQTPALRAGDLQLLIRATAPDAYPGQVALITQTIQVSPFYQHSLKLVAVD
jgi:hypothetical protein